MDFVVIGFDIEVQPLVTHNAAGPLCSVRKRCWKYSYDLPTVQLDLYALCVSAVGFGWLVGCFGFNGPLRQYFSLYRAVSQREGEKGKKG